VKEGDGNGVLPEGWATRCIGQILDARYGKALPQKARRGGGIAVYGSNGPVGAHDEAITAAPVIVIGRKGSVGAINYSEEPVWPIDTTYFIDKFSVFEPEFLRGLLLQLGLDQMDRSTAIPGLSREQLYERRARIPPLAEQHRIAERLDEIDRRRASVGARLQTVRTVLERLRSAVFAAACSGRLTEDWRNVHPEVTADKLHAELIKRRNDTSSRQDVPPSEHGLTSEVQLDLLPSSWSLVRLGDILDVSTGATPLRKNRAFYDDGTIPWVTSGAVNARTITSPTELITPLALKETNVKLFPPGTLLVAMYGEGQTRGRVAELAIEAGTNQAVAAVLFTEATAPIRPFIRLFFEDSYRRVRALSVGGVQPNLNLGMIKDTLIPLPPHEEQDEIVRLATVALETVDRLTTQLAQSQETLDSVSRASLVKAFRGELVPTEVALAAEERRDFESGEELLTRVMPDKGDRSDNGRHR
jgi:type I restriction enzyme S subunit